MAEGVQKATTGSETPQEPTGQVPGQLTLDKHEGWYLDGLTEDEYAQLQRQQKERE